MWTIAKLTIKEIMIKRVFTIIFVLSALFLLFYGLGTHYAAKEWASSHASSSPMDLINPNAFIATQLFGMGLYFSAFIVSLLAIFSSVGGVSKEIESRQIDPILSRPLTRGSFIWGRFIGLALLLVGYAILLFSGVAFINQYFGGVLSISITSIQFIQALGLFIIQPIILVSLSLCLSTRISTLNSGIIMVMLYVLTMIGGFIEQIGGMVESKVMVNIGIVTSLVFPMDSVFRKMIICLFDAADNPISMAAQGIFGSVSIPSNLMIIYAAIYGLLALAVAVRSFAKRDL